MTLEEHMATLSEEELDRLFAVHAAFCTVFSDKKRLQIMWLLRQGERRVSEIAEILGLSNQNISQHLRLMRDKGAVITRRDGQAVYYRVSNEKFLQGCNLIREGLLEELGKMGQLG